MSDRDFVRAAPKLAAVSGLAQERRRGDLVGTFPDPRRFVRLVRVF